MQLPEIVTPEEWGAARERLLVEEKAATRHRDAIAARRRRLPMVPFDGEYALEGPDGPVSLPDLFEGRSQLIVYHFWFAPGDEEPCSGCSMFTSNLGHPDGIAHLHDRDATFALVSFAPQEQLAKWRERMGWKLPWYTDTDRAFSSEAGITGGFGLSVFLRQGEQVWRTYFTTGRGVEALSGGAIADLLPLGRQESQEDSPEGWPQQPTYSWGALHDSYPKRPTAPSAQGPLDAVPPVASAEEWQGALDELRAEEKRATRERDALAAERRRLPMVKIDKDYRFQGPGGEARLLDMFEGRRQLILYHFMLEPGTENPCDGCAAFTDSVGHLAHLHARDTSMAWVSLAPIEEIERVRERMGWEIPWYSSHGSDFNADFGRTTPQGEMFGLSVFLRDGDDVYRTYFTQNRGVDGLGTVWTLLDLTPLGRQETWEDSPEGHPQGPPYVWWQFQDEYDQKGEPAPSAAAVAS